MVHSIAVGRRGVRRLLGMTVAAALLATFLVSADTSTPALAAEGFGGTISVLPSGEPSAATGGSVSSGGGTVCDSSTASPDIYCGYTSFGHKGFCSPVSYSGLPPASRDGLFFSEALWRDFLGPSTTPFMYYPDPYDGTSKPACYIGASWTESLNFYRTDPVYEYRPYAPISITPYTSRWVYKSPTEIQYYTNTSSVTVAKWSYVEELISPSQKIATSRTLTWSYVRPTLPTRITKWCPTQAGPGLLTGPYGNSVTMYPQYLASGAADPQTLPHRWTRPAQYSPIGTAQVSGQLIKGSTTALNLVLNCGPMNYQFTADQNNCSILENGTWVTRTGPTNCGLVPGNYDRVGKPYETNCAYAYYPQTGERKFISCTASQDCTGLTRCIGFNSKGHVPCPPAAINNTSYAPDNYNFFTCTTNPNPPPAYSCTWSFGGGLPEIFDPYGRKVVNGSQVSADGKPWRVNFPALTVGGKVVKNQRVQFVVAKNSQPVRKSLTTGLELAVSDPTQPVFGATTSSNTTTSILTRLPSSTGQIGWPRDLYLRFYKASTSATAATPIGSAEPEFGTLTGATSIPKDSILPYGVYAVYRFTYDQTLTTSVGGTVTRNVPGTCRSPLVLMYPVSGRVGAGTG
jgi:hypothetical protein